MDVAEEGSENKDNEREDDVITYQKWDFYILNSPILKLFLC